jgi:hypothetical protein
MPSSPPPPPPSSSPLPPLPTEEFPRDSIIFTLARFVGTLVALSSITILTVLVLLLKALLVTLCDETIGLAGVLLVVVVSVTVFLFVYLRRAGGGRKGLIAGIIGGMDM